MMQGMTNYFLRRPLKKTRGTRRCIHADKPPAVTRCCFSVQVHSLLKDVSNAFSIIRLEATANTFTSSNDVIVATKSIGSNLVELKSSVPASKAVIVFISAPVLLGYGCFLDPKSSRASREVVSGAPHVKKPEIGFGYYSSTGGIGLELTLENVFTT